MAQLSDTTKDRVRLHLSYPLVDQTSRAVASVVLSDNSVFVLESQMNNVSATAEAFVTPILDNLDAIKLQMVDALERLQARKADVVELNPNEHGDLQGQYKFWRTELCNLLCVTVNPHAQGQGSGGINFKRR